MKFKIDPKIEAENLPKLIGLAGEGIIIPEFLKKIKRKNSKQIYSLIKDLHKNQKKDLIKRKKFAETFWKVSGKKYLNELKNIFGMDFDKNKTIYFTPTIYGIADVRGGKNVFIGKKFDDILDYILLHELVHLFYAEVVYRLNLPKAWKSALMEGVDHLIIFKSPIKNLLKSSITYEKVGFVKFNKKFMLKLEKFWKERKNFKSFLKEAIKLNEKTKGVKIC